VYTVQDKESGKCGYVFICLFSSKGKISHMCGVSDRSKLSTEEYDALNKLVQNHVLINRLGDVFKKAVSTVLC
jgi:hypothetical protein